VIVTAFVFVELPRTNHSSRLANPCGFRSEKRCFFCFERGSRQLKLSCQTIGAEGQELFDRDTKELIIGFCAVVVFAAVLIWLQQ
jgi:hypothetical protein